MADRQPFPWEPESRYKPEDLAQIQKYREFGARPHADIAYEDFIKNSPLGYISPIGGRMYGDVVRGIGSAVGGLKYALGGEASAQVPPESPMQMPFGVHLSEPAARSSVASTAEGKALPGRFPQVTAPGPEPRAEIPKLPEYEPLHPAPTWAPLQELPAAPGINVVRDASGRIISASTENQPQAPGAQPFTGETRGAYSNVGEGSEARSHELASAMAERQFGRASQLERQMSPIEQRHFEEELQGPLGRDLMGYETQRQLHEQEQEMLRRAQMGIDVSAIQKEIERQAVLRSVLRGKSEEQWVMDQARAFAAQAEAQELSDPGMREKRHLPPDRLDPRERITLLAGAIQAARDHLDQLLLQSQYQQGFRGLRAFEGR